MRAVSPGSCLVASPSAALGGKLVGALGSAKVKFLREFGEHVFVGKGCGVKLFELIDRFGQVRAAHLWAQVCGLPAQCGPSFGAGKPLGEDCLDEMLSCPILIRGIDMKKSFKQEVKKAIQSNSAAEAIELCRAQVDADEAAGVAIVEAISIDQEAVVEQLFLLLKPS